MCVTMLLAGMLHEDCQRGAPTTSDKRVVLSAGAWGIPSKTSVDTMRSSVTMSRYSPWKATWNPPAERERTRPFSRGGSSGATLSLGRSQCWIVSAGAFDSGGSVTSRTRLVRRPVTALFPPRNVGLSRKASPSRGGAKTTGPGPSPIPKVNRSPTLTEGGFFATNARL